MSVDGRNTVTEQERQRADASPRGGALLRRRVTSFSLRYGMVWALLLVIVVAQIIYPNFLTAANLTNVLSQNAPVGIIAVGMTLVIIAGGFDLSVGAVYGLGAVFFAIFSTSMSFIPNLILTVLVGVLAGLINGLIIAKLQVNPFVATLGTSSLFLGLGFILALYPISVAPGNDWLGGARIGGIPVSGILMIIVFLIGGLLLSWTTFGQGVKAIGGNGEAARLAGLRDNLIRVATYVIAGGLSALAGSVDASLLGTGQADMGPTIPLLAIAIVILGGTSLAGGEGAMWRTAVGLMIMAALTNLFNSEAAPVSIQYIAQGAVLIAAVSFDMFARRASRRGVVTR